MAKKRRSIQNCFFVSARLELEGQVARAIHWHYKHTLYGFCDGKLGVKDERFGSFRSERENAPEDRLHTCRILYSREGVHYPTLESLKTRLQKSDVRMQKRLIFEQPLPPAMVVIPGIRAARSYEGLGFRECSRDPNTEAVLARFRRVGLRVSSLGLRAGSL